jgi:hypothetical protein
LCGKYEGKKLLGRPKRRQKYNGKMYLKEIEIDWKDMGRICLAEAGDAWLVVVNMVMNLGFKKVRNFFISTVIDLFKGSTPWST